MEWSELVLPLEIIRLFGKFVKTAPTKLSRRLWDAVIIFLVSWQNSVNKSRLNHEDSKVRNVVKFVKNKIISRMIETSFLVVSFQVRALTVAVSELYYEIQTLFERHERDSIDGLPSTLLDEWKNVFADDLHHGMAITWTYFVGE